MNWRNRVLALFTVRHEEARLVTLLLLYSFCLGLPQIFTETVGTTLFLTTFDARSMAYVYIGFAVVIPLSGLAYTWLESRLSLTMLLTANLGFLLTSLIVLWLILTANLGRWPVVAIAIWGEVVWVLTSLAFGGLIGQLFNVRQGKRLFGLVGSGQVLAGIIGGFSVPMLVSWVGTTNLLLGAAAGIALALACLPMIMRASHAGGQAQPDHADSVVLPQLALLKNRYIVLIFAFSALSLIGYFFLDNLFYIALEAHYPDEDQLAGFLGVFYGLVGLLTLMGRSVIAARLFRRYGVLGGLLAVPVAIGIGALPVWLVGQFFAAAPLLLWLIVATKLLNDVFKDAINQPISLILYQILPSEQRLRAQTVVESMVEPIASGLAGTALLVLASLLGTNTNGLVLILLGILIIWSIVGVQLSRMYGGVLLQALTKRRLGGATLVLGDGSSRAVIQHLLDSPRPDEVIYALNLLQEQQAEHLPALLLGLLDHPEARVRLEALRRIELVGGSTLLPALQRLIATEAVPAVRSAALRALTILGGAEVFDQVLPYLDDPDQLTRRDVGVGLLRSGEIEGVLAAGERLIAMVRSPAPELRIAAAIMLGEVGNSNFYRPLYRLLADEQQRVREAALRAAGQICSPRLWPLVIDGLASTQTSAAAATALVQGGASTLPALARAFSQPDQTPGLSMRIARVCGRIRTPEAAVLLLSQIEHPHPDVRQQVLLDLQRCGYVATGQPAEQIMRLIEAEAQGATDLLAALADIGEHVALLPLQSVLRYQIGRSRERIFGLLGLLYDHQTILRARDSIASGSAQQQAYGFEVLDLLLSAQLKPLVLPLCDQQPAQIQLQQLATALTVEALGRAQRLALLAGGPPQHWITACAHYARHQLGLEAQGDRTVITLIEKVVLLKTVSIFAEAPDEVLADLAAILEEQLVGAEQQIFAKGEPGRCMYIVAAGRLRAHDGERLLNYLEQRDVFGEMAVLGSGLRAASVTAIEECQLLRLDQEALYELMADRVEVARGIIHVLLNRLNARMQDVSELQSRVQQLSLSGN